MLSKTFAGLYKSLLPNSFRTKIQSFIIKNSGANAIINGLNTEITQLQQFINQRENRIHPFVQESLSVATSDLTPEIKCIHEANNSELGRCFDRHGSDKNQRHSYSEFYEGLLKGIESPRILEIGLGSLGQYPYAGLRPGGSIQAWRDRYPNSVIVGADIDPDAVSAINEIGFQVDQTDSKSLENLSDCISEYGPFDLIVDDGFHEPHANLLTAMKILPHLSVNGSYVIEDVHSSLINLWRLIIASLNLNGLVVDMSECRPDTDDNILILLRHH
jgi:hypothetical protein